jgi:hypothetical protein
MKQYSMATIGTSHTMPIPFNGTNTYINFEKLFSNDPLAYFSTDDENLQKAIEASKFFKEKEIRILGEIESAEIVEEVEPEPDAEKAEEVKLPETTTEAEKVEEVKVPEEVKAPVKKEVVNEEVTTFQEAKKILTSEPYNVSRQALTSPERVLKKASENGITFTNLHLPEA